MTPDAPDFDERAKPEWVKFAQWLTQVREGRGFTRADAAREAGISYSTWTSYEKAGRLYKGAWVDPSPSRRNLVRIGRVLDVPTRFVFHEAGQKNDMEEIVERGMAPEPLTPRIEALEGRMSSVEKKVDLILDRLGDEG